MTDKLPPNLLALFAPRPPLRYLPPSDHAPQERTTNKISGLAQFLPALQEYKETDEYEPTESWLQRKDRVKLEKLEARRKLLTEDIKHYKPSEDPAIRGDAFKTLFVSRLGYDVTQNDLEHEFGKFGPIERIRIVTDTHAHEKSETQQKKRKHRGYAFIVYEREKDMKAAYKETDGIRIKDRRVLVDVERGRTVSGWRPRRFGGGLGGRGYTKAAPARPMGPGNFGGPPMGPGGFRGMGGRGGGFRGGFGGDRDGGSGGFRGGRGGFGGGRGGGFGGRGGVGYQGNGFGAPEGAPSGPRGPRGGGFGGAPNGGGYGDRDGGRDRGPRFDDRRDGPSGSNREPLQPRGQGGYRDRDREGGGYDRKRPHDGDGYQDPRQKRRY